VIPQRAGQQARDLSQRAQPGSLRLRAPGSVSLELLPLALQAVALALQAVALALQAAALASLVAALAREAAVLPATAWAPGHPDSCQGPWADFAQVAGIAQPMLVQVLVS
jgi:hypothetical protein